MQRSGFRDKLCPLIVVSETEKGVAFCISMLSKNAKNKPVFIRSAKETTPQQQELVTNLVKTMLAKSAR